jgi:aryl-alcohol dehydrogenase-like predicted oxidoreductase
VIVKEALANGRLTARGDVASLPDLAERAGTAPDAFALAAALSQPWADIVLSGATTVAQLRSNLAALEVDVDPGIEAQLAEDPKLYWEERAALPWN